MSLNCSHFDHSVYFFHLIRNYGMARNYLNRLLKGLGTILISRLVAAIKDVTDDDYI